MNPENPEPTQPTQPTTQPATRQDGQQPVSPHTPDNTFGGMIPTGNKKALTSYYLGFGAILPILGVLFFIPAIILGIQGFKYANEHPEAKGKNHAITGIVLGSLQLIGILLITLLAI